MYNLSKTNSLCFGKISKFPVFSLRGNFFGHFPCFPCAVGTLHWPLSLTEELKKGELVNNVSETPGVPYLGGVGGRDVCLGLLVLLHLLLLTDGLTQDREEHRQHRVGQLQSQDRLETSAHL